MAGSGSHIGKVNGTHHGPLPKNNPTGAPRPLTDAVGNLGCQTLSAARRESSHRYVGPADPEKFNAEGWLKGQCEELKDNLNKLSDNATPIQRQTLYSCGHALVNSRHLEALSQQLAKGKNKELMEDFRCNVQLIKRFFSENNGEMDSASFRLLFAYINYLVSIGKPNADLKKAFAELENQYLNALQHLQVSSKANEDAIKQSNQEKTTLALTEAALEEIAAKDLPTILDGDTVNSLIVCAEDALKKAKDKSDLIKKYWDMITMAEELTVMAKAFKAKVDEQVDALYKSAPEPTIQAIRQAISEIDKSAKTLSTAFDKCISHLGDDLKNTEQKEAFTSELSQIESAIKKANPLSDPAQAREVFDEAHKAALKATARAAFLVPKIVLRAVQWSQARIDSTHEDKRFMQPKLDKKEELANHAISKVIESKIKKDLVNAHLPADIKELDKALIRQTAVRLASRVEAAMVSVKINTDKEIKEDSKEPVDSLSVAERTKEHLALAYKTYKQLKAIEDDEDGATEVGDEDSSYRMTEVDEYYKSANEAGKVELPPQESDDADKNPYQTYLNRFPAPGDIRIDSEIKKTVENGAPNPAIGGLAYGNLFDIAREIAHSNQYTIKINKVPNGAQTEEKATATETQKELALQFIAYSATLMAMSADKHTDYAAVRLEMDMVADLFGLSLLPEKCNATVTNESVLALLNRSHREDEKAEQDLLTLKKIPDPDEKRTLSLACYKLHLAETILQSSKSAATLLDENHTKKTFRNDAVAFGGKSRQEVFANSMMKVVGMLTKPELAELDEKGTRTGKASRLLVQNTGLFSSKVKVDLSLELGLKEVKNTEDQVYSPEMCNDLLLDQLATAAIAHNDLKLSKSMPSRGSLRNRIDKWKYHSFLQAAVNHQLADYDLLSDALIEVAQKIRPKVFTHLNQVVANLEGDEHVSPRQIQHLIKQIMITTDAKSAQSREFDLGLLTQKTKDFGEADTHQTRLALAGALELIKEAWCGKNTNKGASPARSLWKSEDQRTALTRAIQWNPVNMVPGLKSTPYVGSCTAAAFEIGKFAVATSVGMAAVPVAALGFAAIELAKGTKSVATTVGNSMFTRG